LEVRLTKHLDDFKDKNGKWVQRSLSNGKHTWTISGVLWNNIKERCTVGGATQSSEPTYIGCINEFKGFQDFTEWHILQTGYGMGYQLDADILKIDTKKYSENNCVLIPPALNKFLQTTKARRGEWPQGITAVKGVLRVNCTRKQTRNTLGYFKKEDVLLAVEVYTKAKNLCGQDWYKRLIEKEFTVDVRVIEYMKNWRHTCDWKSND